MATRQVTAIALKLLAIWLLIQLVLNLPALLLVLASAEHYQQQTIPMIVYLGMIISFLVVGLTAAYLINKSANSVLNQAESQSETSLSHDAQKVLLQLLGLYFVVNAVAYLPRSLAFIPGSLDLSLSNLLWPAGLTFQLVIGLWLVASSTFWVSLLQKLRGRT